MAVVQEIIRTESDNTISFGDYSVSEKKKAGAFEHAGDIYSVKTHNEITRIEKNGSLLLETVPGATIHNLKVAEDNIVFGVEGFEDTQITIELEGGKEYRIYVNDTAVGEMKSSLSGKINFSVDLNETQQVVRIKKMD